MPRRGKAMTDESPQQVTAAERATDALLSVLAQLLARYAARTSVEEAHSQAAVTVSGPGSGNSLLSGHRGKRERRRQPP